jgi:hypothetical protein
MPRLQFDRRHYSAATLRAGPCAAVMASSSLIFRDPNSEIDREGAAWVASKIFPCKIFP